MIKSTDLQFKSSQNEKGHIKREIEPLGEFCEMVVLKISKYS